MAKISNGQAAVVTAPVGGVIKDNFYILEGVFGSAMDTVAAGKQVVLNLEHAEHRITQAGINFGKGDRVYFDGATQAFSTVNTKDRVGVCTEATASNMFAFKKTQEV